MKAAYTKPQLHVEYFAMSQSIAASCGAVAGGSSLGKPSHWGKADCGWDMGNMIIWVGGEGNPCTFPWGEDDEWEGVCYNNPTSSNGIFGSY